MKNTLLIILACATLAISSCSTHGSTTTVTPTSSFSVLFPHIDTATLWNNGSGQWTGAFAKITSTGAMVITGYGPYVGGSYKIQITDSIDVPYTFSLLRAGVDTVISSGCEIAQYPAASGVKGYYYMVIEGGNLPIDSIVRGVFVDSI